MMSPGRYDALADLLGGYFHQDYDHVHGDEAGVLDDFVADGGADAVRGVVRDVDRFVADHAGDLPGSLDRCFSPDITIGPGEEEARAWLAWLRAGLLARLELS